MCYKQKCKVVSLNLAHPVYCKLLYRADAGHRNVTAGTPVNRIPIMAKQTLDLYELFRLVVSKGGLVEVINKKLWREITKGLNLPSSITSAAFTLRTQSVHITLRCLVIATERSRK